MNPSRDLCNRAVTHRNSILQIVDRVLVMEKGRVVTDTTPQQLGVKGA